MTTDELWDALREVACSTKPPTDAKTIVQLKREHIAEALKLLKARSSTVRADRS